MTRNPRTIGPERLAAEAVEIMERNKVNQLLVVDEHQQLVGALNMQDVFRGKVIRAAVLREFKVLPIPRLNLELFTVSAF